MYLRGGAQVLPSQPPVVEFQPPKPSCKCELHTAPWNSTSATMFSSPKRHTEILLHRHMATVAKTHTTTQAAVSSQYNDGARWSCLCRAQVNTPDAAACVPSVEMSLQHPALASGRYPTLLSGSSPCGRRLPGKGSGPMQANFDEVYCR